MKKEKKYGLLITLMILFLAYVVLSWIIPNGTVSSGTYADGTTNPVGLFGLIYYPVIAFGSFVQYGFVVLAIGALYGVMAKTGVYGNLVEKIANKFVKKEKLFLILTIAILALLSSVVGLTFAIFMILPLFIAVLTKMGFSNVTVLAATFGSVLVGRIGSIIGYDIAGISTAVFGTKVSAQLAFKAILFVLVTTLFVLFVISKKGSKLEVKKPAKKTAKKVETKKNEKKTTAAATKSKTVKKVETKEEVKEEKREILFLENEVKTKKSSASLVVILIVLVLVAFLSMYDLNGVFGLSFFNDLYDQLTAVKIGNFAVFEKVLGLTGAFGTWNVYELIVIILLASITIAWVYNLSFDDYLEGVKTGAKRMLKPAFYVTMANILFTMMLVNSSGTIVTYVTNKLASLSSKFNVFSLTGSSIFASLLFNHYDYMINAIGTAYSVQPFISESANLYSIIAFVCQGIFGVIMLLLPTSMVLIGGLSILNVKIKDWFKYIWIYALEIFVIVVALSFIVTLV